MNEPFRAVLSYFAHEETDLVADNNGMSFLLFR